MGKVIKRTLQIVLGFVVLLGVLAAALIFFFDANRLKPFIIERVYQTTGYELVLDGPLSWSFFPTLGVTTGHLGLKNPPGTKKLYLVEADRLRFSVHFLPLLHGKVEAGTLAVMNVRGEWTNPATHQSVRVSHLNGWAEGISLTDDFPVKLTFDVATQNPKLEGQIVLRGNTSINLDQKIYSLAKLELKATVRSPDWHTQLHLGGSLHMDQKQGLFQWQSLVGKIGNIPVEGDLRVITSGSAPVTTGNLTIQPFDLKTFLAQAGVDVPDLQEADSVSGMVHLSVTGPEATAQGNVSLPVLRFANLRITRLVVPFQFQKNTLDIQAAKADLYEGKALLKAMARFQSQPWQYAIQAGLNGLQVAPLLHDLDAKSRISVSGTANIGLLLSASGSDAAAILSHLNGTGRFSVTGGMVRGVDVGYLLDSAMALAGKKISPTLEGNTAFRSLTGTAVIRDGVVSNNDLAMDSPRFTVAGKGTVNLPASRVNYALEAHLRKSSPAQRDDISNLFGLPVPILITGSMESPDIRLDSATLMQALAKQQLKKAAGNLLPPNVQKQLPGNAAKVIDQLLGQ